VVMMLEAVVDIKCAFVVLSTEETMVEEAGAEFWLPSPGWLPALKVDD
jgi:hypothetical protein